MKNFSMQAQVNWLRVTNHLIALWGLYIYPIGHWWLLSVAGYFLFTRVGSDVGFHRYFTHKGFKAHPFVEGLLMILGTLDCKGSLYSWVTVHYAHHRHADAAGDPHAPKRIGFRRVIFNELEAFTVSRGAISEYVRNPFYRFCHEHYFFVVLSFIVLLGLVNLRLLVFLYCIPMVYSLYMTGLINYVGHSYGYRNFATNDTSYNNTLLNVFTLGGGLHNNHHADPAKVSHATNRWFEWDPAAWVAARIGHISN